MALHKHALQLSSALANEPNVLRQLIDNLPDNIFIKDLESRFVISNLAHAHLLRAKRLDEIVGKTDFDIFPPELAARYYEDEQAVIRSGEPLVNREERTVDPEGKTRWLLTTKVPLRDDQGNIIGIAGINRDITERKRMEDEIKRYSDHLEELVKERTGKLAESEARFKKYFELGLVGMAIETPAGDWVAVNDRLCEMFGYSREELMKKHWLELTHPDDLAKDKELFESLIRGQIADYSIETRLIRKDGQVVDWIIAVNCTRGRDGKADQVFALGIDITERKQMQEMLSNERNVLRTLIDNLPDIVYIKDLESRFVTTNPVHVHHLRANRLDEIVGKTDFDLYPREIAASYYEDEQAVIRSGEPLVNREERTVDPEGKTRWLLTTKVPLRDDQGNIIGIAGIGRDITERKRMQEELERYSKHLEELVEERTEKLRQAERLATIGELATMVAHDLRNPLQGIATATYNLKRSCSDKERKRMLRIIDQDIHYSDNIVSELLEYSREIRLKPTETSAKQIIESALVDMNVPRMIQVVNETTDKPAIIVDFEKMRRVVVDIVTNAFDAMPKGGRLCIESRMRDCDLEIAFEDTGTGMSKETLEKIWNPLFTTKARGIGLGLAIAKRFVEAHGGSISVDSRLGSGSTFKLLLPVKVENVKTSHDLDIAGHPS
jgi:PAS domain S-box-containing protein